MGLTVGFDATAAARQAAGIGRYTRELLQALARRRDNFSYRVYYCNGGRLDGSMPQLDARFQVRALPVSDRVLNAVWHRSRMPLPVQWIAGKFDVFHSPDFALPPTLGRPSVLTIHDAAFLTMPDCAYPTLRAYLQHVVPRSARRATRIIAVSENTRRDVIALMGIPPERVITVFEGVPGHFGPVARGAALDTLRELGIREPYILCVGTLEPRKNYVRLLEAYALLRERGAIQRLVIAGRRGWLYEPIFRRLKELELEQSVQLIDRPSDAALMALYSACDLFAYPSLYEGFGIPPLEALACGAPVVCSGSSSLPEVVGDAALTFDPLDVEQFAASLERVLSDDAFRDDLRERGPRQAAQFSWERAACQTVEVYEAAAHA